MQGFPPPPQERATLENWQSAPVNRWSFHHVREVVPTARVSRGTGPVHVLRHRQDPHPDVARLEVPRSDAPATTVAEVMGSTETDGWLVLADGQVIAEEYPSLMPADATHLLMSVSKSVIGCVTGILIDQGTIDASAPVTAYLPALAGGGYDGATVRHLLDMRSGIRFSEDYLDPTAEVRVLEEVIGWRPRTSATLPTSMYDYLASLTSDRPHGGDFRYRSGETDVLGWVCESAAGCRMPELLSELLWSRLGMEHDADIGVDSAGAAAHDGGLNATVRDLARFGQLLLDDGAAADGSQVVPAWWLQDTYAGGPDSRPAFASSPEHASFPGGMYRNKIWVPHPDRRVLLCLGIHGQLVYVNADARVVGVKVSSWPVPQDTRRLLDTLAAFDAIAACA